MMRARGQITCKDGNVRPIGPPYQCRAASLVYQISNARRGAVGTAGATTRVPEDWHMVPPELL
eukprot:7783896-Lingulodinium_polyedra.AAC.1